MQPHRFSYDIHGVVQVASSVALPDLEYFAAPIEGGDVVIAVAQGGEPRALLQKHEYDRTIITVSEGIARAPHILFTSVLEPVLGRLVAGRGHALVHAACVRLQGDGVLIAAAPGAGKTTLCLELLERADAQLLGDDTVILGPGGLVLSFPKAIKLRTSSLRRLSLSRHARSRLWIQAIVHTRGAVDSARRLSGGSKLAARAASLAHRLVPPPRLGVAAFMSPSSLANSATLTKIMVPAGPAASGSWLSAKEVAQLLATNTPSAASDVTVSLVERPPRGDLVETITGLLPRRLKSMPTTKLAAACSEAGDEEGAR